MLSIPYRSGYQIKVRLDLSLAAKTFTICCGQSVEMSINKLDAYLAGVGQNEVDGIVGSRKRNGEYLLKVRGKIHNSWSRNYIAQFIVEDEIVILHCTARLPVVVNLISRLYGFIFVVSSIGMPICAFADKGVVGFFIAVIGCCFMLLVYSAIVSFGNSLAVSDIEYFKDKMSWLLGSDNATVFKM